MAPKKYGDHMSHDVKGGTNVNFQPQILIRCSSGSGEYEEPYATSDTAGDKSSSDAAVGVGSTRSLMLHPTQLVAFRSKATENLVRGR